MTSSEMEQIRRIFPDNNVIFKLNPDKPASNAKLKSAEWQIILQIDGKKKLQDIIDTLTLSEDEILPLVFNLCQKELLVFDQSVSVAPPQNYVDISFFNQLADTLVNYIGPVASYVINDVLLELNEQQDQFLKEKVPLLIETLSQEIVDEAKRVKFQKEMLGIIKNL